MNRKTANVRTTTQPEIRREGFQALLDRLGPAGTTRFLRQYDAGRGDYSKERHQWLDSVDDEEVIAAVKQRQDRT
ncbi:MAG: hypothetical protein HY718_17715 [Planctomycetes bacterium]|nr:hypothetical protein [Planctomycetota bacterium]